jgi:hypothetical protein
MRFSILTYLIKDTIICWIKTPGSLAARVLLATSLLFLYLIVNSGFMMSEMLIKSKIEKLGANNVLLRASPAVGSTVRPKLSHLLSPLEAYGTTLFLELSYVKAKLPGEERVQVVIYADSSLQALTHYMPDLFDKKEAIFYATLGHIANYPIRANLKGVYFDATPIKLPSILGFASRNKPILLIPDQLATPIPDSSRSEIMIFQINELADLERVTHRIDEVLAAEGFDRYYITSSSKWANELNDLQAMQRKGRGGLVTFVLLLTVMVYGSIAVFEYRQNIYTTALIKSFGIPKAALFLRYLLESLMLLFASLLIAVVLAKSLHVVIFSHAGFGDAAWMLESLAPYSIANIKFLLVIISASGVIGNIPILLALNRSIGRILG